MVDLETMLVQGILTRITNDLNRFTRVFVSQELGKHYNYQADDEDEAETAREYAHLFRFIEVAQLLEGGE